MHALYTPVTQGMGLLRRRRRDRQLVRRPRTFQIRQWYDAKRLNHHGQPLRPGRVAAVAQRLARTRSTL